MSKDAVKVFGRFTEEEARALLHNASVQNGLVIPANPLPRPAALPKATLPPPPITTGGSWSSIAGSSSKKPTPQKTSNKNKIPLSQMPIATAIDGSFLFGTWSEWDALVSFNNLPQLPSLEELLVSSSGIWDLAEIDGFTRGLVNPGNLCFSNVILQSLARILPFRELVLKASLYKLPVHSPVLLSFANFFINFEGLSGRNSGSSSEFKNDILSLQRLQQPFVPTSILEILPLFSKPYQGVQDQEDAQEYLSWILDRIHEETMALQSTFPSKKTDQSKVNQVDDEWQEVSKGNKVSDLILVDYSESPITQIFSAKLRSVVKRKGSKASVSFQPFNCLPLDISDPNIHTLEQAFRIFLGTEYLEGVFSSKLQEEVEASKRMTIEKLPEVLIVQLKRFTFDERGLYKIRKFISYPMEWVIDRALFTNPKLAPPDEERRYQLVSVISHHGERMQSGHYTCDIQHRTTKNWYHFDDRVVEPSDATHVTERQAYLLFYCKTS